MYNDKKLEEGREFLKSRLEEAYDSQLKTALDLLEKKLAYIPPVRTRDPYRYLRNGEWISMDPLQGFGIDSY